MRVHIDRRILRTVAGLLAASAILLAGMLLLHRWEEGISPSGSGPTPPNEERVYYQGSWYVPREDVETVLVLGLDRSEMEDISVSGAHAQSDFILLLRLDRAAKTCKPILLNRDTMAEIQDFDRYGRPSGTYQAQLALAYAHAQACTGNQKTAGRAAADGVSRLLYGVKVDHYVTLTMDGLIALNDLAGGVTVEVKDDFSAIDPTLVQGETVTLVGEHALNYVRTRWWVGDSTNLERMERQREYLNGLQKRMSALLDRDEDFILNSLLSVNEYMDSDCTIEQLAQLAEDVGSFTMEDDVSPEGEAVMGKAHVEFRVDEDALQALVIREFYEPAEEG